MAKRAKHPKGDQTRFGARFLIRLALVLIIGFCTWGIVSEQNAVVEQKKELAALEEKIESMTAQNEELAHLIESDDIGRYMEKLAVEEYGYAYPDERRYYDTSRD